MDYLSILLEVQNKIKDVRFHGEQNLTHLLFVDDILLFVEDDESIDNMRNVIHLFELASEINMNPNKSTVSYHPSILMPKEQIVLKKNGVYPQNSFSLNTWSVIGEQTSLKKFLVWD